MKTLTIQQIAEVLNAEVITGTARLNETVSRINIDSRQSQPDDCFFAIAGENFDGHDYIPAAITAGTRCAIIDKITPALSDITDTVILKTDNTISALGQLAKWYRRQLSAQVVAITGSAGKTTTRRFCHHVLNAFFRCYQAPKSFNNNIGLPLTILAADKKTEILLLELGTNAPGEIEYLAQIANPDIACITFIGPAHIEGFGSIGRIIREKCDITKGLKPDGTLIINGDQPGLVEHIKSLDIPNVITAGFDDSCDIIGTGLNTTAAGGSFKIAGQTVTVPLPGRANLVNALTSWSICSQFNISISDFNRVIGTIEPVSMRMQIETVGPITVINDCYNANPASMTNALEHLAALAKEHNRRAVFIAGHMGELGAASADYHRELGRQIAQRGIKLALIVGQFAADVQAGIEENNGPDSEVFPDAKTLCQTLTDYILPGDIVLVKGSRSASLEKTVAKLRQYTL